MELAMKILYIVLGSAALLLSTSLWAKADYEQSHNQQQVNNFKLASSDATRKTMRSRQKRVEGDKSPTVTPVTTSEKLNR